MIDVYLQRQLCNNKLGEVHNVAWLAKSGTRLAKKKVSNNSSGLSEQTTQKQICCKDCKSVMLLTLNNAPTQLIAYFKNAEHSFKNTLPQPQSKKTSRASVPLSLRRTKKKTAFL
jgi:hypothetical protein